MVDLVVAVATVALLFALYLVRNLRAKLSFARRMEEQARASAAQESQSLRNAIEAATRSDAAAAKSSTMAERWKQKYLSIFAMVESIIRERNEWKNKHLDAVAAQHEALVVLEQSLVRTRHQLAQLFRMHNELLGKKDMPPVGTEDLERDPVGQVGVFFEKMRKASKDMHDFMDEQRLFYAQFENEASAASKRIGEQDVDAE